MGVIVVGDVVGDVVGRSSVPGSEEGREGLSKELVWDFLQGLLLRFANILPSQPTS